MPRIRWTDLPRRATVPRGGLPEWPGFDVERSTMIFDNACLVKDDPDGEELKALDASMKWK
jgi:hypothetical protein